MKIAQIVILATLIPIFIAAYLIAKFVFKKQIPVLVYKISAGILALVFFVIYMSGDDLISNTIAGENNIFSSGAMSIYSIILIWFTYASILLVCLQPFFKIKTVNNLVKYFVLPFSIIATFSITVSTQGILGADAYIENNFRGILMAIELVILVPYAFIVFMEMVCLRCQRVKLNISLFALFQCFWLSCQVILFKHFLVYRLLLPTLKISIFTIELCFMALCLYHFLFILGLESKGKMLYALPCFLRVWAH